MNNSWLRWFLWYLTHRWRVSEHDHLCVTDDGNGLWWRLSFSCHFMRGEVTPEKFCKLLLRLGIHVYCSPCYGGLVYVYIVLLVIKAWYTCILFSLLLRLGTHVYCSPCYEGLVYMYIVLLVIKAWYTCILFSMRLGIHVHCSPCYEGLVYMYIVLVIQAWYTCILFSLLLRLGIHV